MCKPSNYLVDRIGTLDEVRRIHPQSLRIQTLLRSQVCVECGVQGTVWRLERQRANLDARQPHWNCYARVNGQLVMMTADHIRPKSRGGPNQLRNLQTMCWPCNLAKGSTEPK